MNNQNNQTKEFGRESVLPTIALLISFLFPIVGAIMGHVALNQMKSGQISSLNRTSALAAVILGWCLTVLLILLIPFMLIQFTMTGFFGSLTYK